MPCSDVQVQVATEPVLEEKELDDEEEEEECLLSNDFPSELRAHSRLDSVYTPILLRNPCVSFHQLIHG
jgi:hypothetical protein